MKILIASIVVLMVGLMVSCELILDIELPQQPEKLVVNSIIMTDCVMSVEVRHSIGILDTVRSIFEPVLNANVTISDEFGNMTRLEMNSDDINNYYRFAYRAKSCPVPGNTYTLSVNAPGFESIESKTRVPDLVKNIQVSIDSINSANFNIIFNIKFSDDPTQRNYYETYYLEKLKRSYTYTNSNGETLTHSDTTWYRTRIYYEYTDPQDYKSLFSDTYCNNECSLKGTAIDYYGYGGGYEILEVKIEILNINPDYYEYLTTGHLQGSSYNDPTAQPVQVYNNINNGYGIFSGFSKSYFILK